MLGPHTNHELYCRNNCQKSMMWCKKDSFPKLNFGWEIVFATISECSVSMFHLMWYIINFKSSMFIWLKENWNMLHCKIYVKIKIYKESIFCDGCYVVSKFYWRLVLKIDWNFILDITGIFQAF